MKFLEAKLVTLGQWSVGKTCIVKRYVDKAFEPFYKQTIGACFFWCKIDVGDDKVTLQIWDTAGQERFKSIMPMYYRAANAVLLIFDLTKYETFTHIKSILVEFNRHFDENVVLILVGNKLDLVNQRQVSEDEAREYASLIGASYHETSALQDIGIDEIFQTAAAGLVRLVNEGENTNMNIYDCSRITDKSREQVLKLLNEPNDNKKKKRKKCSCK